MIGQICHHFGWTFDYVLWEIDWRIVQRMLIDIPEYKTEKDKKEIDFTQLSDESIEGFLNKYK